MTRWFRFNADAMRNPKVARLSHSDFRMWMHILCVAAENDGRIPPIDDLVTILRQRRDNVLRALLRLRISGLIDAKEDCYEPHNWDKYQFKSDTSTPRVRKFRAKGNVSETPYDNNTYTYTNTKKDKRARDALFDRFMAVYPKRTNRKTARTRFDAAVKAGVDPEKMIAAAERYAEHVKFTEPQFIKAPDAWLNAGKYDDELPAEPPRPQSRGSPRGGTTGFAAVLDHLEGRTYEQPAEHKIRDITPGAADTDRSHDPSDLFEPVGGISGRGEVLDFRAARADVGGQAIAFGPSWRASG